MRGWEVFSSTMIMSQFFRDPMPLNCELHQCFSALSPNLPSKVGQDGYSGIELGISHLPDWLGSEKTLAG